MPITECRWEVIQQNDDSAPFTILTHVYRPGLGWSVSDEIDCDSFADVCEQLKELIGA